jgi:hypothetical protein
MAHVPFLLNAMPESGVAALEDLSQDTVAGFFRALPACLSAQSKSLALRAGFFRYCDRFRTIPIKFHECFLPAANLRFAPMFFLIQSLSFH